MVKAKKGKNESDQEFIKDLEKEVGKEGLRVGLDSGARSDVAAISTRVLSLDAALGVGGVPRGRIIEIFGSEGSGKTTLSLSILAQCQKDGGTAAFIDAEHALDPNWCRTLGVDTKKILFSQPDNAEQVFKIIDLLVKHKRADAIVVDSVAALASQAELDGEIGGKQYPETARLLSQELRRLCGTLSKSSACVIFINQIRDKMNSPIPGQTGTTGGRALRFYSSIRMDIRRTSVVKGSGSDIVGSKVQVKVVKNKVAPPFKTVSFDILFDKGISKPHELISLGLQYKILERSGSWVLYNDNKLGQSALKSGDRLADDHELAKEIEDKVVEKMRPEIAAAKPTEEDLT